MPPQADPDYLDPEEDPEEDPEGHSHVDPAAGPRAPGRG
jgi:hypothetical protein